MFKVPNNDESVILLKDYQKPEAYIPYVVGILNKFNKGILYFGVTDRGEAIGTIHTQETLANIAKDFSENIYPKIYPSIVEIPENKNVIKITFEGTNKPYCYKSKYYLKDYKDLRTLDYESILKELKFTNKNTYIEDEEVSSPIKDLDEDLIKKTFDSSISSKRFITKSKKFVLKKVLTDWGLLKNNKVIKSCSLLFNKKSSLSVTINVLDSENNYNILDTRLIKGNILNLIEECPLLIKTLYSEKYKIKNRVFPINEIREIFINALMHANYNYGHDFVVTLSSYKISVLSPGKFPNAYLPEDFAFAHVRPIIINKIISKIIYYAGYANLNGTGFNILFKNKKEALPYSLKQKNTSVEFTYFIYTDKNKNLTVDKAILSILIEKPFIKSEEIGKKIGKTRRTVQTILKQLKEKNLITRKGSKKTGYWIVNK